MNEKSKIEKFFKTDTLLGQVLLTLSIYVLYILLADFVIPVGLMYIFDGKIDWWTLLIIMWGVCPILSFYIPFKLSNIFHVNKGEKVIWYLIHGIITIIGPIILVYFAISQAIKNFP